MDQAAYASFYALDQSHFWRIAKRRLVLGILERHFGARRDLRILDIGGACSIVTAEMKRFGSVISIEPDPETAEFARKKLGVDFRIGSLPDRMPIDGTYDVITLLDVLEHIDDDHRSLEVIQSYLKSGGIFICTVPALMWLWSDHDVTLHHKRRYTRPQLRALLTESRFSIQQLTYHTSLLFPVLAAERIWKKIKPKRGPASYDVKMPHPLINQSFGAIMSLERWLLRRLSLPLGSSLLAVCARQ